MFAEANDLNLIEINLERHLYLDDVFKTLDIQTIISNLLSISGKSCNEKSLLFLDEIQATPNAIAALRYFYEDKPELPVIATGSLLEFALSDHEFSMPVGRIQTLHLGPVTFEEMLLETAPHLLDMLNNLELEKPLPESTHHQLTKYWLNYIYTGGMPEAMDAWLKRNDPQEVIAIQDEILGTYMDDFSKYAQFKDLADLQRIFRNLPGSIAQKIKYTQLLPDGKSRHTQQLLDLLEKARIFSSVWATHASGLPLAAGINPKVRKSIFLDIGLVNRGLGIPLSKLEQMDDLALINKGDLAEQFIGQHLLTSQSSTYSPELLYWCSEGSTQSSEIDFVISHSGDIIPIEVKAGKSGSMKSLHVFMKKKKLSRAVRFDLQQHSQQEVKTSISTGNSSTPVKYALINLPLYAVGQLESILS
jgi:predicted AAA+ superfamily ATPase